MKKILLFAAVTFLSFSAAQSQELRLGAKAGVNLASIAGDEIDDFNGRIGFHVGALVEIPISEKFAVQNKFYIPHKDLRKIFLPGGSVV